MKAFPKTPRREFLKAVAEMWPLAKGCVSQVRRPCIRAKCKACARGEKHPAWIFTFRKGGKQRCRYVPKELVPALRQAIANARRVEAMLTQAGEALIERHRAVFVRKHLRERARKARACGVPHAP
jgi:hypothetical protein